MFGALGPCPHYSQPDQRFFVHQEQNKMGVNWSEFCLCVYIYKVYSIYLVYIYTYNIRI